MVRDSPKAHGVVLRHPVCHVVGSIASLGGLRVEGAHEQGFRCVDVDHRHLRLVSLPSRRKAR